MLKELVVIPTSGAPYRLDLDRAQYTLGRRPDSDIAFPGDSGVSVQHALIRRRDGDWILSDQGSTNGTFLNEQAVTEPVALKPGDSVRIGSVTLMCIGAEQELTAVSPAAAVRPRDENKVGAVTFRGRKLAVRATGLTPFAYGRTSVLFRGTSTGRDELCIKLFPGSEGQGGDNLAAFEREVGIQERLVHECILPVLDYGVASELDGGPFVVVPYCHGGSLRQLRKERAFFGVSAVMPLLEQVARALDFAHESGVIHGDVKPQNVLLSADRKRAFLSDFGMANVFAVEERFTTVVKGPEGGTTAYMSPEQISDGKLTPLCDIFAFAVMTYELLTGRLPFDQNVPTFRQMLAKVNGDVIDPLEFNPQISDGAKAALLAGLRTNPLERPRTATEFCQRLSDESQPGTERAAPTPKRSRSVFVSYSHADAPWLARVQVHLKPLARAGLIDLWDDTRIDPGQRWRREIDQALEAASVAVLLVSSDFLASDFCAEQELPRLLKAAEQRGVKILPLVLSPCRIEVSPALASFQAVNDPKRTLVEMDRGEQERTLTRLAAAITESITTAPQSD